MVNSYCYLKLEEEYVIIDTFWRNKRKIEMIEVTCCGQKEVNQVSCHIQRCSHTLDKNSYTWT